MKKFIKAILCLCMLFPYNIEAKTKEKVKKDKEQSYAELLIELNDEIIKYANENNIPIADNGDIVIELPDLGNINSNIPMVYAYDDPYNGGTYNNANSITWNSNSFILTCCFTYNKTISTIPQFRNISGYAGWVDALALICGGAATLTGQTWITLLAQALSYAYSKVKDFTNWYAGKLQSTITSINNDGLKYKRGVKTVFKLTSLPSLVSCTVTKQ